MSWVDSDIGKARALVIDGNPSTRIGLATMLREYGVEQLQHTSSVQDARRMLELRRFDIVVCDMHFPGEPMTGQDMLDDLRLANLLPLSTVFIMLSPDAVYAKVAEAAEAASDGYLIKPHTEKALRDRLALARQRKHALKDITDRIERQAFTEAAQLCQQRVETRGSDWLLAARIGAELWLRVGQPRAALAMFGSIHEAKAIPWAKLGIARANGGRSGSVDARPDGGSVDAGFRDRGGVQHVDGPDARARNRSTNRFRSDGARARAALRGVARDLRPAVSGGTSERRRRSRNPRGLREHLPRGRAGDFAHGGRRTARSRAGPDCARRTHAQRQAARLGVADARAHRGAITDSDDLTQQATSLRERYCSAGTQVRLAPMPPQATQH